MVAALSDSMALQDCLNLLTTATMITTVTLYHQVTTGIAHITIRKTTPPPGQGTQEHYWWEAQGTIGSQAWDDTSAHAYPTAETAYQAAVQAVHAAGHRLRGEATADEH